MEPVATSLAAPAAGDAKLSPRSGPSSVALGERKDLAPVPVASHPCSVRAQGRVGQVDSASLSDRRALCRRRLSRGACFLPGPASRCPAAEPNPASPISNRARLSFSLVGAGALVVVACLETCGRTPEAARRKVPSHCGRCGAELSSFACLPGTGPIYCLVYSVSLPVI